MFKKSENTNQRRFSGFRGMDGRFSVKRVSMEGVDNCGLQLHENVPVSNNSNGDFLKTGSSACLYENNPGRRRRSLAQLTREALPRLENYRNSRRALKRPSLGELHGGEDGIKVNTHLYYNVKTTMLMMRSSLNLT